jgi:hypothetical protein
MARKEHQHHYIYKTTCNVTGKYYIGMHSTSNLEDGYIGSGRRLWLSIKKHGKENHSIEILEWLPDRLSLKLREKEIVNENMLSDPSCMNLAIGGGGGKISDLQQRNRSIAGGKGFGNKLKNDPLFLAKHIVRVSEIFKNLHRSGSFKYDTFTGKTHSAETKKKISESNKGKGANENNSQFGTCWITNGIENKKIKKEEKIPNGWKLGRKIKN